MFFCLRKNIGNKVKENIFEERRPPLVYPTPTTAHPLLKILILLLLFKIDDYWDKRYESTAVPSRSEGKHMEDTLQNCRKQTSFGNLLSFFFFSWISKLQLVQGKLLCLLGNVRTQTADELGRGLCLIWFDWGLSLIWFDWPGQSQIHVWAD